MQTKKNKKQKPSTPNIFFQKKPKTVLFDLKKLQKVYNQLKSPNPSADRNRHQLRSIQLAQQLVDPKIDSTQTILTALANKIGQIKSGVIAESEINTAEDNCRRYPCEYSTTDYDAVWAHYVNCLLQIPLEDSIIETDVYNYGGNVKIVTPPEEDPSGINSTPLNTVSRTLAEPPTRQSAEQQKQNAEPSKQNFFSRLFSRKSK